MKTIEEIIQFLNKNNISLVSRGCYNLPNDVAIKSIEEFNNTGKSNLIKQHQRWI